MSHPNLSDTPMPDYSPLRQRLLDRRAELDVMSREDRVSPVHIEIDPSATGQTLRQDELEELALALARHDRHLEEIQRIEHALDRMEQGTYGRCLICDDEIAPARLWSDPAAATCLDCASAADRGL